MKTQTGKLITKKILIFALTLLVVGLANATNLMAQNDLDPTFGSGGKVVTDISGVDFGNSLALQPDGKFIVVGAANAGSAFADFAVVRYNADGSLDASFGAGGKVITDFGRGETALAVAVQPDGKIIAAGDASLANSTTDFALARYNPNGSLDTTFGAGGRVTTDFSGFSDSAGAVIIQPDGKIVAAGRAGVASTSTNFALVRYNSDGSLDTTFGSGGKVSTDFNGQSERAFALVLQADGKLAAAGSSGPVGAFDFALARYNSDGSLDSAFGSGGRVVTDFAGQSDLANSLVLQADGKLVAAGVGNDFGLARYNPEGSLDSAFGNGGKVTTDFAGGFDVITKLVLQTNGKITAAGQAFGSGTNDFGLARYNPNGSLDTTFGAGGKITTDFGNRDSALGIVLQPDGKIAAAGFTANANFSASDFALARYLGDSVIARRALFDFDGDGRADQTVFRPSDGVWYLLRSSSGFTAASFGISTDRIAAADFDGDGRTDIAVFRDGVWYWLNSSNGTFQAVQFGQAGDVPVPADFSGDGRAELAVYRGGVWFTLNLADNQFQAVQFGVASDKSVPADFDGDGRTDFAVYRDGVWFLLRSTGGFAAVQFGIASDKPTVGDYDGDGRADQAVYRAGVWYILGSTQGFVAVGFGIAGDIPAAADYDGDGKTDVAVYRGGIWYLLGSQQGFDAVQFGIVGDRPIPAAFVP